MWEGACYDRLNPTPGQFRPSVYLIGAADIGVPA
jgi:hypothetical protein